MSVALLAAAMIVGARPPAPVVSIEAYPRSIQLDGARDRQGVVVRGVDATGLSRDLGAEATFTLANPALARVDHGALVPLADGETSVVVSAGGLSATIPVRVRGASAAPPKASFRRDVVPALTRSGCNSGACHGSARGQDGFHLSLFGYDPAGDYRTLLQELPGRRVNLASPERSLLLAKATGAVGHTGGQRFPTNDDRYATLLEWLKEGAPDDPPDVATVIGIELVPSDIVLAAGATQSLGVRATYSDGTDRDVTSLATLITSNDFSAKVRDDGVVVAARPGEAQVLARFGAFAVGTSVIVVPPLAQVPAEESQRGNYVDECVSAKLKRMRVAPSELCSDEEFLRRATLDLNGTLPTVDEYARFMADASPEKRARLVDELTGRKEFSAIWVMKWAERLAIRSNNEVSAKSALLYYTWLQSRLGAGAPIDQVVREIIACEGGTFDTPATNFYQLERDTLKLSENVAQAFMGTRIQCAQCHNHPFDRWTMDDYYGLAAFFAQIGRKPGEDPRETIVFNSGGGETNHPVGGRVMAPKFLGGAAPALNGRDRRAVLAEWLTSPDNPMFARNVANFVWAHFFHRGIVEPVDDVRASNPPCNEALLAALAAKLVEYRYDIRPLVRDICASRTYQRSSRTNATNAADDRNFSHACARRIRAEFLLDSITRVTGTKDKFDGLPLGARALEIADGTTSNYFLTTFGRATRQTVCTCEVQMEPSLSQALHLMNGDTVNEKIKQGGRVASDLAAGKKPEEVLDWLYVAALSRHPSDEERAALLGPIAQGIEAKVALEDAFWAILNSREFLFNH
ncbi:MAG: DUF1549 and DUF1553 domain-containing protein [Phycisphaerales bacterium]